MRRITVLATFLAFGAGAVLAQSNVIDQRKAEMKAMGGAAGSISKMMKGEEAFDLAKVKTGLETLAKSAKASVALYPAESKTGDTKALPAIWDNKAKFDGLFAKLEADANTALAAIKDEASFKAEAGKVFANCGGCHTDFRAK
ncbi:MAG: cytochrome c [Proteobacteria bacterium]|nr:cytochrome c [Pseudomonadota bacterium]